MGPRNVRSGGFDARLLAVNGARVAQGRDQPTGALDDDSVVRLDEAAARSLAHLEGAAFRVGSVEERPYRRKPAAPFRTATLQQEQAGSSAFGPDDDAGRNDSTRPATSLHAHGLDHALRVSLSSAARTQVRNLFEEFVPDKPRRYGRAVANAQEAHEAIRPAGDEFRAPKDVQRELGRDEHALYDLIWSGHSRHRWRTRGPDRVAQDRGKARPERTRSSGLGDRDHLPRLSRRLRTGS